MPKQHNQDDTSAAEWQDLTTKIRAGDPEAISQFFDLYHQEIRVLIGRFEFDAEMADELSSEVFAKVMAFHSQIEGADIRPWSKMIAMRVVYDHGRKTKRRHANCAVSGLMDDQDAILKTDNEHILEEVVRREQVERLRDCLKQLPEKYRETINCRYFRDMTLAETASELKCVAVSTVRNWEQKARDMLRECMSD